MLLLRQCHAIRTKLLQIQQNNHKINAILYITHPNIFTSNLLHLFVLFLILKIEEKIICILLLIALLIYD